MTAPSALSACPRIGDSHSHEANDLLAFSRVGRTTERFQDVDLTESARGAIANLKVAIEESEADVRVSPLPTVRGDPGLLVALWQNLIGNSIKFSGVGPPVVVLEALQRGDRWECRVSDNGIGIEARFAERIFVIFQRLHSRESYSGTGIGLALCKKIVEFHGGDIWLDVDHHPGTRICFTLPAQRGDDR